MQSEHQTLPVAVVMLRHDHSASASSSPIPTTAAAAPVSIVPTVLMDPVDEPPSPVLAASSVVSIIGPWIIEPSFAIDQHPQYEVSCVYRDGRVRVRSSLFALEMTGVLKVVSGGLYSWVQSVDVVFTDGHREEYPVDEDGFAHGFMKYFRRTSASPVSFSTVEFTRGCRNPISHSEALKLLNPTACDNEIFRGYIRVLEFRVGEDKQRSGVANPVSCYFSALNLVDYVVKKLHADGKVECTTVCYVETEIEGPWRVDIEGPFTFREPPSFSSAQRKEIDQWGAARRARARLPNILFASGICNPGAFKPLSTQRLVHLAWRCTSEKEKSACFETLLKIR
jgi:hypothetical protein